MATPTPSGDIGRNGCALALSTGIYRETPVRNYHYKLPNHTADMEFRLTMTTDAFVDFHLPPSRRSRRPITSAFDTPLVTIVTPYFNAGEEFDDTAKSVLAQTLTSFEWIIVNDGTTDPQSTERLASVARNDPRIRIVEHVNNRGLAAARNTGFEAAKSEAVFMIDADDEIEPTAIEKCFWYLVSFKGMSFCSGFSVGFGANEYKWKRGFHNGSSFMDENLVTATCMVAKSVHRAVGGFDTNLRGGLEDWDFWLRCADRSYWGGTIPEYLDWYRRRPDHSQRWSKFNRSGIENFRQSIPKRFTSLAKGRFPNRGDYQMPPAPVAMQIDDNVFVPSGSNMLFLLPWASLGGADYFNINLLRSLVDRGIQPTVIFTEGSRYDREHEFYKITPDVFCLQNFLQSIDYIEFMFYLIKSRCISTVVISNSELGYSIVSSIKEKFPNLIIVDYNHMEEEEWIEGGYPRLSIENAQYIDRHIVSSNHLKEWMESHGVDGKFIDTVYINVDTKKFSRHTAQRAIFREKYGLTESDLAICFSGRLVPQKQPDVLGASIIRVLKKTENTQFFICGGGPYEDSLRQELADHIGSKCHFLGDIAFDDMPSIYSGVDVLFLPSRQEGISLAMYEAMAASCAVVGADVGGQRELVDPSAGILINSRQLSKSAQSRIYAMTLIDLANNVLRASEMGKNGRSIVEAHFPSTQLAERFLGAIPESGSVRRPPTQLSRRLTAPPEVVASKVASRAVILANSGAVDWKMARDRSSRVLRLKWYLVDYHPWLARRLAPIYRRVLSWRWSLRRQER